MESGFQVNDGVHERIGSANDRCFAGGNDGAELLIQSEETLKKFREGGATQGGAGFEGFRERGAFRRFVRDRIIDQRAEGREDGATVGVGDSEGDAAVDDSLGLEPNSGGGGKSVRGKVGEVRIVIAKGPRRRGDDESGPLLHPLENGGDAFVVEAALGDGDIDRFHGTARNLGRSDQFHAETGFLEGVRESAQVGMESDLGLIGLAAPADRIEDQVAGGRLRKDLGTLEESIMSDRDDTAFSASGRGAAPGDESAAGRVLYDGKSGLTNEIDQSGGKTTRDDRASTAREKGHGLIVRGEGRQGGEDENGKNGAE